VPLAHNRDVVETSQSMGADAPSRAVALGSIKAQADDLRLVDLSDHPSSAALLASRTEKNLTARSRSRYRLSHLARTDEERCNPDA
jgi:hypothetical protein